MAERENAPSGPAEDSRLTEGLPPAQTSLYERYKDALRRGHVAVLRSRFDAAIDAYGEAASIATDRALPHTAIGGVLVKMQRLPEALAAYERALALQARDEAALRGRADVLAALGRRSEAAEALDLVADLLEDGGRLPDAADAARRALELAESRQRRRNVEALAARLRASSGDEAAERALSQVLRVLEPPVRDEPSADPGTVATEDEIAPGPEAAASLVEEPEPEPEPPADGVALGAEAEAALAAGDADRARDGLLAAARAHRAAGRSIAAIDACYLALAVGPADIDLHLLLAELYIERGWRATAVEKLVLLHRLADLSEDAAARARLCALVADQLPNEPRLAELCA